MNMNENKEYEFFDDEENSINVSYYDETGESPEYVSVSSDL
jgi:hypothetical protein